MSNMNTPWMEMTLREYQAALASSSPTPGGGTAAAIALGQASALTCMVCDLTIGKEKWKDGWAYAEETVRETIPLLTKSGILADDDSQAFDDVMAAYKLPKETEIDKQKRREAIKGSSLRATNVPLETAQLSLSLLERLPHLAKVSNVNAISDVGVASLLASAACKGALFNVEINLPSIPEKDQEEIGRIAEDIQDRCRKISRSCMDEVKKRLSHS
ncbi:MAG TPA: methenyltetrahydrofolate cyclohydrolase [Candidatus Poseidoniales archaeon]|nr:methenyltetrahydrofolate cyclohydrolase [Euryarchaeota archaeon]DAC11523.1 MAG TPA: methenyltetrahydrofolate cyclohydrolase [Candidatus Poseidoniales archaeon]|tara:strand:- start:781 stop:1428 length:648 start_codon:yes stop_codon:yes gene_type:complete